MVQNNLFCIYSGLKFKRSLRQLWVHTTTTSYKHTEIQFSFFCEYGNVFGLREPQTQNWCFSWKLEIGDFLSLRQKRNRDLYNWSYLRNNDSAKQHRYILSVTHFVYFLPRVTRSVKTSLRSNISPQFLCDLSEFKPTLFRIKWKWEIVKLLSVNHLVLIDRFFLCFVTINLLLTE